MVKSFQVTEDVCISVKLKDGREFKRMHITDKPFGDNENVVSFWESDDTVAIYPLGEVAEYKLHQK